MTSRERSEFLMNQACPCTRYDTYVGTPETVAYNISWGNVGSNRSMSDVVTPGFLKLRNNGGIVNSPMGSFHHIIAVNPKGFAMRRDVPNLKQGNFVSARWTDFSTRCSILKANASGIYHVPELIERGSVASLETEAITGAFARVGSPDIQTLVSVAEGKQALALLANPIQGITQIFKQAKYNRLNLRKFSEGASQQWLATNFGIIPMLMDIQGTLRALSRVTEERMRETARSSVDDVRTSTVGRNSYIDTMYGAHSQLAVSDTVKVRAGVLYEHHLSLADRLGVTATYIPASLWEHMPWSFVFDYIVNIGDVINALTPKASTNTLAAWVSTNRVIHANDWVDDNYVVPSAFAAGWRITASMVGGSVTGTYYSKRRRPVSRSDVGFAINVNLSQKRLANLAAILVTRLKTKPSTTATPKRFSARHNS